VNNCAQSYTAQNIGYCSQFTKFPDCVDQGLWRRRQKADPARAGSGYVRQFSQGFGRLLEQYRSDCATSGECVNVEKQPFQARDRCVWCVEPGPGGGVCRAGNDFGVVRAARSLTPVTLTARPC
jgi:hypothetical protein